MGAGDWDDQWAGLPKLVGPQILLSIAVVMADFWSLCLYGNTTVCAFNGLLTCTYDLMVCYMRFTPTYPTDTWFLSPPQIQYVVVVCDVNKQAWAKSLRIFQRPMRKKQTRLNFSHCRYSRDTVTKQERSDFNKPARGLQIDMWKGHSEAEYALFRCMYLFSVISILRFLRIVLFVVFWSVNLPMLLCIVFYL